MTQKKKKLFLDKVIIGNEKWNIRIKYLIAQYRIQKTINSATNHFIFFKNFKHKQMAMFCAFIFMNYNFLHKWEFFSNILIKLHHN